jgi:hypothetical protein
VSSVQDLKEIRQENKEPKEDTPVDKKEDVAEGEMD